MRVVRAIFTKKTNIMKATTESCEYKNNENINYGYTSSVIFHDKLLVTISSILIKSVYQLIKDRDKEILQQKYNKYICEHVLQVTSLNTATHNSYINHILNKMNKYLYIIAILINM